VSDREKERESTGNAAFGPGGSASIWKGRSLIETKKRGFSLGFDPIPASFPVL
jgi:hypothetical protein